MNLEWMKIGLNCECRVYSRTRFIWSALCDAPIANRLGDATIHIRSPEQVVNLWLLDPAATNVGSPHTNSTDLVESMLSFLPLVHVHMYHLTTLRFPLFFLLCFLVHRCRAGRSEIPNQPAEGNLHAGHILIQRGSTLPGLVTSPRLFCPAPLPKNRYGVQYPYPELEAQQALAALGIMFPPCWSYLNFSSLQELCSIEGKAGANFGGQVRSEAPSLL